MTLASRSALAVLLALSAALVLPAASHAQAPPVYVEITDGFPPRQGVAAASPSRPQFTLIVRRGGVVLAARGTRSGRVFLPVDPQAGDVVTVTDPAGRQIGTYTWDGTPTIRACATATSFRGTRSDGTMVVEQAGTFLAGPGRYAPRNEQRGTITLTTPTAFTVALAAPLSRGQLAFATASQQVPGLFVRTTVEAPVGATCADTTPPRARLLRIAPIRLRTLLSRGLRVRVRVDEPATITHRLYVTRRVRRNGRFVLRRARIGARSVKAPAAGVNRATIRLSRRGKRLVRRLKPRRLRIVVDARDAAGNGRPLPPRQVVVRR